MAACCQPLLYGGGKAGAVLIKRADPWSLDPIFRQGARRNNAPSPDQAGAKKAPPSGAMSGSVVSSSVSSRAQTPNFGETWPPPIAALPTSSSCATCPCAHVRNWRLV